MSERVNRKIIESLREQMKEAVSEIRYSYTAKTPKEHQDILDNAVETLQEGIEETEPSFVYSEIREKYAGVIGLLVRVAIASPDLNGEKIIRIRQAVKEAEKILHGVEVVEISGGLLTLEPITEEARPDES